VVERRPLRADAFIRQREHEIDQGFLVCDGQGRQRHDAGHAADGKIPAALVKIHLPQRGRPAVVKVPNSGSVFATP